MTDDHLDIFRICWLEQLERKKLLGFFESSSVRWWRWTGCVSAVQCLVQYPSIWDESWWAVLLDTGRVFVLGLPRRGSGYRYPGIFNFLCKQVRSSWLRVGIYLMRINWIRILVPNQWLLTWILIRVSDPVPHGSALIWAVGSGSGSGGGGNDPKE